MSKEIEVRKSILKPHMWIASIIKGNFVQPDKSSGLPYYYTTEAEAQAAVDLYLGKQKPIYAVPKMREYPGGATRDTDETKLDY